MGLCVSIDMKDKVILFVGGGRVALRKAERFLSEGAKIRIVAPYRKEEFAQIPCIYMQKEYEYSDLQDCFMVVAASDAHEVNERVIQDAKAAHILCMSVERDSKADVHALVYDETGSFQLAVSTKQHYPALNQVILQDVKQYVADTYEERLQLLIQLRTLILMNTSMTNKYEILRFLAKANKNLLTFLLEAIEKKACILLCFHGVKPKASMCDIQTFLQDVRAEIHGVTVGFAFLSNPVVKIVNQETNEVLPLSLAMQFLSCFDIHTTLYPMLFQEGRFYDQMCMFHHEQTTICEPPFRTKEDIRELIHTCLQVHPEANHMICIYHSSKTGKFANLLEEIKAEFSEVLFLHEAYKRDIHLPYHGKTISIFPLYMLQGMHMHHDTDKDSSLFHQLKENACTIVCNEESCLKQRDLKRLIIRKIIYEMQRTNTIKGA